MKQSKPPDSALVDPERAPPTTRDDEQVPDLEGRPVGAASSAPSPAQDHGYDSYASPSLGVVDPLSAPSTPLTSTLPSVGVTESPLRSTAISPGGKPPLAATLPSGVVPPEAEEKLEIRVAGEAAVDATLPSAGAEAGGPGVGGPAITASGTLVLGDPIAEGTDATLGRDQVNALRKRLQERDAKAPAPSPAALPQGPAQIPSALEVELPPPEAPAASGPLAPPTRRSPALAVGVAVVLLLGVAAVLWATR